MSENNNQNQNQNTEQHGQQQNNQVAFDYDKLASIINGKQTATEDTVLFKSTLSVWRVTDRVRFVP